MFQVDYASCLTSMSGCVCSAMYFNERTVEEKVGKQKQSWLSVCRLGDNEKMIQLAYQWLLALVAESANVLRLAEIHLRRQHKTIESAAHLVRYS